MPPDPIPLLLRGLIDAIANRPNEPDSQSQTRAQAAIAQIESLAPTDTAEVLFAGQIALYQTLILDAVNDAHAADSPAEAHKHRQQAIALGRLQISTFAELRRHRADQKAADEHPQPEPEKTPDPPPPIPKTPPPKHPAPRPLTPPSVPSLSPLAAHPRGREPDT